VDIVVKLKFYFFWFFEFFLFVFLLLSFSNDCLAVPKIPTFGVSRSGATTTYTVGQSTYQPLTAVPSSGSTALTKNWGATSTGYATTANIPIGETIQAVKINSGVSASSVALAVGSILLPKMGLLGVGIVAGTALYDYLNNGAGITVDSIGTVHQFSCSGAKTFVQQHLSPRLCALAASNDYSHYECVSTGVSNGYVSSNPDFGDYTIRNSCGSAVEVPFVPADAVTHLNQVEPNNLAGVLDRIHNLDVSGDSDPVGSFPVWEAPANTASAPTKTVQPDGSVSSSTKSTNCTQNDSASFGCTETEVVTTTKPDNGVQALVLLL